MRGDHRLGLHAIGVRHAEVDDPPGALRPHDRGHQPAQVEDRVQVAIEHGVPALERLLEVGDPVVWAGAVQERVDPAQPVLRPPHQVGAGVRIRDVALDRERPPPGVVDRLRERAGVRPARPPAVGHVPAPCRQVERRRASDSACAPCDQGDSAAGPVVSLVHPVTSIDLLFCAPSSWPRRSAWTSPAALPSSGVPSDHGPRTLAPDAVRCTVRDRDRGTRRGERLPVALRAPG